MKRILLTLKELSDSKKRKTDQVIGKIPPLVKYNILGYSKFFLQDDDVNVDLFYPFINREDVKVLLSGRNEYLKSRYVIRLIRLSIINKNKELLDYLLPVPIESGLTKNIISTICDTCVSSGDFQYFRDFSNLLNVIEKYDIYHEMVCNYLVYKNLIDIVIRNDDMRFFEPLIFNTNLCGHKHIVDSCIKFNNSVFFKRIIKHLNSHYEFLDDVYPYHYFVYHDAILNTNNIEFLQLIVDSINQIGYKFDYYPAYMKAIKSKNLEMLKIVIPPLILNDKDPIFRLTNCFIESFRFEFIELLEFLTETYKSEKRYFIQRIKTMLKSYFKDRVLYADFYKFVELLI